MSIQMHRTTLVLPKKLYIEAKVKAMNEQKTVSQLVQESLEIALTKKQMKGSMSFSTFLQQDTYNEQLTSVATMSDDAIEQAYRAGLEKKYGHANN